MLFDANQLNFLDQLIKEQPGIENGFDLFNTLNSHLFKEKFKRVDKELLMNCFQEFNRWLGSLLTQEPIPLKIKSLWFGIFEKESKIIDDMSADFEIYLTGSQYTPEQNSSDWPCVMAFCPKNRYSNMDCLSTLKRNIISYMRLDAGPSPVNIDIFVTLFISIIFVINAIKLNRLLILQKNSEMHIGTGYDDGDIFMINKLTL
jgi:hypothetical protein